MFSLRDHEYGYVSLNGKKCWAKKMLATSGTQQCGGFFKEESFRITGCTIVLAASDTATTVPLTVRVWTSLDGDASDESFAIANVIITDLLQGDRVEILLSKIKACRSLFDTEPQIHAPTQNMPIHTHTYSQMQTCALPMHRRTQRF